MTTKGLSRKHIIIPMSSDNISSFMKNSSLHVANINRSLQNAKTDVLVNYIHSDNTGISVVVNKVAQQSDMSIIDKYIKNSHDINSLQVKDAHLPMSKSYLKITGIPYYPYPDHQTKLTSNDIENILKQNHIFDNISLASKPRVIKVSLKSDMALVWIDIWDVQSGKNTKMLINRCFNIENFIATIRGANMNPGILLCKNFWNGVTPPCCAGFREQNTLNVTALTSRNIIESSVSVVRLTTKLILLDLKPRRTNLALIRSSAPIAKEITKLTLSIVHFGDIDSIVSGMLKSILRSVRTGRNHFIPK